MGSELTFKDIIIYILRQWRKIIASSLIFAFLGGLGSFGYGLLQKNHSDILERNELIMEKYEEDLVYWQKDLTAGNKKMDEVVHYRENSVLMAIDPYNYGETHILLNIETTSNDISVLDRDLMGRLINIYSSILRSDEFWINISDDLDLTTDPKYLSEAIELKIYDGIIDMKIQQTTIDLSMQVASKVLISLQEKREGILSAVGEHDLKVIENSSFVGYDEELAVYQANQNAILKDLNNNLSIIKKELGKLENPPSLDSSENIWKYILVSGLLGMVLTGSLVLLSKLMGNVITDERDLMRRYKVKILASYKGKNLKRR